MKESYDKKSGIAAHLRSNPNAANALTPEDVSVILNEVLFWFRMEICVSERMPPSPPKKVSFSLEKPAVASMIAGAMPHLCCEVLLFIDSIFFGVYDVSTKFVLHRIGVLFLSIL